MLYPIKFLPLFKTKIWGGNKIKNLGFDYDPLPNCGELWALSAIKDNESIVAEGPLEGNNLSELVEIFMGDLVGDRNYARYGNDFPLLIKIIDANDRLSIQVHPDDYLARERGMENGKTEMWYIIDAEENATLIDGFSAMVNKGEYQQLLEAGRLEDVLHTEKPKAGDVYFIPAGRVHALGSGLLLAEVQQSSDCTYRIYDYNRRDKEGNLRELHTDEALDAIDFYPTKDGRTQYEYVENKTAPIVQCPYFTTNILHLTHPIQKSFLELDSFVIYFCTKGVAAVKALGVVTPFHAGECVLVPAIADEVRLFCEGEATLLEIFVDPDKAPDDGYTHEFDSDWVAQFCGFDGDGDGDDGCGCEHHHHHDCSCGEDDCGCGCGEDDCDCGEEHHHDCGCGDDHCHHKH